MAIPSIPAAITAPTLTIVGAWQERIATPANDRHNGSISPITDHLSIMVVLLKKEKFFH
jgi:hypothetical protein